MKEVFTTINLEDWWVNNMEVCENEIILWILVERWVASIVQNAFHQIVSLSHLENV